MKTILFLMLLMVASSSCKKEIEPYVYPHFDSLYCETRQVLKYIKTDEGVPQMFQPSCYTTTSICGDQHLESLGMYMYYYQKCDSTYTDKTWEYILKTEY